MAVVLTNQQLTHLAKTGWKFDLGIRDGKVFSDSVVYTGDGVDDLNRLIDRLNSMPRIPNFYRLTVDVGSLFSSYVIVTTEDVVALRAKFLALFGNVDKPNYPFNVPLNEETREMEPFAASGTVVPGEFTALPGGNPALATPNPPGLKLPEEFEDYGDGRSNMAPSRPPDQEQL